MNPTEKARRSGVSKLLDLLDPLLATMDLNDYRANHIRAYVENLVAEFAREKAVALAEVLDKIDATRKRGGR